MRDAIPEECQLCRPLDYRGDEINEPEGMVEVAREDGGTKIIHCCERCADELFGTHDFTAYDGGGSVACTDGGTDSTAIERLTDVEGGHSCAWYFDKDAGETVADCVNCDGRIQVSHATDTRQDEAFKLKFVEQEDAGSLDGTSYVGWFCSTECLSEFVGEIGESPEILTDGGVDQSGIDRHGRQANHPDEFRATPDEVETFDPDLVLGYFRRLEVLLDACPIDIYAASSLKHPWPYRLQNAEECYPASFWRSPNRLLDSAIMAPSLTNEEILAHADERYATAVTAKDYLPFDAYESKYKQDGLSEEDVEAARRLRAEYGDNVTATTESIKEFVDLYDPDEHPSAYIPIQPPYAEHIDIVYPIVEDSPVDHRYMLGGLKDATPKRRIEELLDFRAKVGEEPVAHGLGWGPGDELVATLREEPGLLDSIDNSGPQNALRNGRLVDKHWQSRPFAIVNEGKYQNMTMGGFELAVLVQAAHRLTEYNGEFEDARTQSDIADFGGVEADD